MSDKKEAVLFFYQYPAEHFPRPRSLIDEVPLDSISDKAVRTFYMSLSTYLRKLVPPSDFTTVDWKAAPFMVGFPIFEKQFKADGPNTLWITVRRANSEIAYGFWIATAPLQ